MQVVLLALGLALLIGVPLGMVSGYLGGPADRLLVLRDGRAVAQGLRDDPSLHRALEAVFDGSIRVQAAGKGWITLPQVE
jgi:ABC-type hemin transport system ATPase subunit